MNNLSDKQVDKIERSIERSTERSSLPADAQAARPTPEVSLSVKVTVLSILSVTVIAEIITMFVGILPGMVIYGALLVVSTNLSYFSRTSATRRLYLAYTLVPMLRLLSMVMPVQLVTLMYRYVMVGVPLLLSTALVVRFNGLPGIRMNLTRIEWFTQLIIGLGGVPLGSLAYLLLSRPPDVMVDHPWYMVIFQVLAITLFGAITEEIIFHGLVQKAFNYPFGFLSFLLTSILYASMFLGMHSVGYIAFYGLVGLFFSFLVQVSDSLWGVILAHSLMNIVFLLIFYMH